MNAISLFSGAGGLDIGVAKAGFNVKVCIENDKRSIETLRKNLKGCSIIDKDIRDVGKEEILNAASIKDGEVDLVFGGPPCQSFSSAGKMRSIVDPRGSLIFEFLRVVKEIKPKVFLFENVKQFSYIRINDKIPKPSINKRATDKNLVINKLRKEFEKLGYKLNYNIINSADYGVPQKRERTIILGTLAGKMLPLPEKTHSNEKGFLKKWRVLGDVIKNLKQEEEFVSYDEKRKKYLRLVPAGGFWRDLPIKLHEEAMGEKLKLGGGKTGFFRRLSFDKTSPTLCTSPKQPGTDMCHPKKLRPLTVTEYAAIQEFPKTWVFSGNTTNKYKQIGNAVPIRLASVLGSEIKKHLEENF